MRNKLVVLFTVFWLVGCGDDKPPAGAGGAGGAGGGGAAGGAGGSVSAPDTFPSCSAVSVPVASGDVCTRGPGSLAGRPVVVGGVRVDALCGFCQGVAAVPCVTETSFGPLVCLDRATGPNGDVCQLASANAGCTFGSGGAGGATVGSGGAAGGDGRAPFPTCNSPGAVVPTFYCPSGQPALGRTIGSGRVSCSSCGVTYGALTNAPCLSSDGLTLCVSAIAGDCSMASALCD